MLNRRTREKRKLRRNSYRSRTQNASAYSSPIPIVACTSLLRVVLHCALMHLESSTSTVPKRMYSTLTCCIRVQYSMYSVWITEYLVHMREARVSLCSCTSAQHCVQYCSTLSDLFHLRKNTIAIIVDSILLHVCQNRSHTVYYHYII